MFMDKTAALYTVNGRIKSIMRLVNHWDWLIHGLSIPNAQSTKRCGNEKPGGYLFPNDFSGKVKEIVQKC